MNIPFKPITIEDKALILSYTIPSNYLNCDLSFSNICSWHFLYDTEFAVVNDNLLIRFWIENRKRVAYMMPLGKGDITESLRLLEEDSLRQGHALCLLGITPDAKAILDQLKPGAFLYIPERDYFDYIYLREELATLKGKKFQSKRNHINNFNKKYNYKYVPLTEDLVPECLELECKWYRANLKEGEEEALTFERRSMIYALENFRELDLTGGGLCVEGQIAAFTFGSPINHNTFGVHVEKADVNYEGAYAVINKEFASRIPEQYLYVNREEDLGIPGLRQAKLSYNPVILLEKSAAIKKHIK